MDIIAAHSTIWLIGLALALLVTGLIAGVLAGMLGVGGGIVIVPVLYHLFTLLGIDEAVRMHVTVGTSLATIVPTSIMSSLAHHKRGNLDINLLLKLLPSLVVGVLIGTLLSGYFSGRVLTGVFAVMALLVAVNMAFKRDGFSLRAGFPGRPGVWLIGTSIGGFSTLMGIGGGTLSVPMLSAFNVPMHRAVGTAASIGMFIGLPGAIGFLIHGLGVPNLPPLSVGYVNLLGMALIVPATMATTGWGAKMAHATGARQLRQVFAMFLALTSLRMFYGLFS